MHGSPSESEIQKWRLPYQKTQITLKQQFSTGVPQEAHWCMQGFLKQAIPDYLVKGTDLCPLDYYIKKWQQPTQ